MSNTTRVIDRCGCARIVRCVVVVAALSCVMTGRAKGDFTFTDFSSVAGLTLNDSAAQVGSVIRLAPNLMGQRGSAWYSAAKAHVADGFDTTFTFQLSGGAPGADGFAFVIQDLGTSLTGTGGSGLGYENLPRSLAVEFDTFGFSPETDNHVSVQSRGNQPNHANDIYSLGQAEASFDLNDGQPHTALIRYRPGVLLLYLDGDATASLVIAVNLQNVNGDNILDGSGDAWVGFTAATGFFSEDHDLLDWSFDETTTALPDGACCLSDSCIQTDAQDCVVVQGGSYIGDGMDCGSVSCDGACCYFDGCTETTQDDCEVSLGGSFRGVGTICDFDTCNGACCDLYGDCFETDEFDCIAFSEGVFHGIGTTCDPFPCGLPEYGACCFDDACSTELESDCDAFGGVWFGAGTLCDDIDCVDQPGPFGACCQQNGTCRDNVIQEACEYFNGVYQGDGTYCMTTDCGVGEPGACCVNGNCFELTVTTCEAQGGHFQGEGRSCSDPNLNCTDLGRCCFTDGGCVTTSIDFCFNSLGGGVFSTPGVCGDFPCPEFGACCESGGACRVDWEFTCQEPGMTFLGQGTLCSPNPCGAICNCRGDLSGDLMVNGLDIQQFVVCYVSEFGTAPTAQCLCADVLADNVIDAGDLSAFVNALMNSDGCPP